MRSLRIGITVCKVLLVIVAIWVGYFLTMWCPCRKSPVARSRWLRRSCRWFAWSIRLKITCVGRPPAGSVVVVGNHVSYLDILAHSACAPVTFISKAEVAGWPIFGQLSRWAGTLFIRREVRSDVVRIAEAMPAIVAAGVPLTFFPEGTSSDGNGVLPFMPSLLAPIVENQWPVIPAFLRYRLLPGDGAVEDDVAYYRPETDFGPHLFKLMAKRRVEVTVVYGEPREPGSDRKALARELHQAVCNLATKWH